MQEVRGRQKTVGGLQWAVGDRAVCPPHPCPLLRGTDGAINIEFNYNLLVSYFFINILFDIIENSDIS